MQHSIRSPLCFLTSTDHQQTSHRLCSIRTGRSTLWLLTSTDHQQTSHRLCNSRSGLHCVSWHRQIINRYHIVSVTFDQVYTVSWHRQIINRHHIVYVTFDQVYHVTPDIDRPSADIISSMQHSIRSAMCLLTSPDHEQTSYRLCNTRSGLHCDSWHRQIMNRRHIVYVAFDQVCTVSPDIDRSSTDIISSM